MRGNVFQDKQGNYITENELLKQFNKELQQENQELKKVIDKINHILNNQINYREFVDIVNAIEDVVKEVSE